MDSWIVAGSLEFDPYFGIVKEMVFDWLCEEENNQEINDFFGFSGTRGGSSGKAS